MMPFDRRLRAFLLPHESIVRLFNAQFDDKSYAQIDRNNATIPRDAKVISVHYEPRRQCLVIVCNHESFPPVEEGAEIPLADEKPKKVRIVPKAVKGFTVQDLLSRLTGRAVNIVLHAARGLCDDDLPADQMPLDLIAHLTVDNWLAYRNCGEQAMQQIRAAMESLTQQPMR